MSRVLFSALFLPIIASAAQTPLFVDVPCPLLNPTVSRVLPPALLQNQRELLARGKKLNELVIEFNATECGSLLPRDSDAEVACGDAENHLQLKLDHHNLHVAQLDPRIRRALLLAQSQLLAKHAVTREKLQALGLDADKAAVRANTWIHFGQQEATRARWELFEQVTLSGLEQYEKAARKSAQLSEVELSEFNSWYALNNKAFSPAAREVLKSKILKLRSTGDVSRMLRYIYEQHARAYSVAQPLMEGKPMEAGEEAVLGLLKLSLGFMENVSPQTKAIVATAQVSAADIDAWHAYYIAKASVDQMLDLRDKNLQAVVSLAGLYRREASRLKGIKAALATCPAS